MNILQMYIRLAQRLARRYNEPYVVLTRYTTYVATYQSVLQLIKEGYITLSNIKCYIEPNGDVVYF